MSFYLTKVDNAATADGSTRWFKIKDIGPKFNGCSATWDMQATYSVTIPRCIPSGDYLLRIQQLGIHNPWPAGVPQFYLNCAQIRVTGGGSTTPGNQVSIPGAFKNTDPGYTANIYNNFCSYTVSAASGTCLEMISDSFITGSRTARLQLLSPASPRESVNTRIGDNAGLQDHFACVYIDRAMLLFQIANPCLQSCRASRTHVSDSVVMMAQGLYCGVVTILRMRLQPPLAAFKRLNDHSGRSSHGAHATPTGSNQISGFCTERRAGGRGARRAARRKKEENRVGAALTKP